MLSYALAIAVAISSLVLFSTAFLMSHIHRKDDFFWSGIGLFYALVLWYCAKNITGAVLLGQTAATALLISYCWQTINLRRAIANPAKATEINNFSILRSINGLLKSKKPQAASVVAPVKTPPKVKVTEQKIAIPNTPAASAENPPAEIADDPVGVPESTESIKGEPDIREDKVEATVKPAATAEQIKSTSKNSLKEVSQNSLPDPSTEVSPAAQTIPSKVATQEEETEIEFVPQAEEQAETATPTLKPVPETPKNPQKAAFDSLETVEVAEVLEAIPEDGTSDRDADLSNIIEVTTTEINITTEVKQVELERKIDSASDESNNV